jgi:hypothetical protein
LIEFNKFELRAPAPQNSIDIFSGKWPSDLSKARKVLDFPGVMWETFRTLASIDAWAAVDQAETLRPSQWMRITGNSW